LWKSKVSKGDFSDCESLQNFFQTSAWEIEDTNLKSTMKSFAQEHLDILLQNFEGSFPKDVY